MLFEARLREGIHEDRIVLAFRRWRRCQVVAGHRYRTRLDLVEAVAVDVIAPADIDDAQAREAGYATLDGALAALHGPEDLPLYRIRFRRLDEPDPRDTLASAASLTSDEMAAVTARLARMDLSSARGPWTNAILALIADQPATSSAVLASSIGWARPDLKQHVRRLKNLGLTISLDVGYKLSPRGEAYIRGKADARKANARGKAKAKAAGTAAVPHSHLRLRTGQRLSVLILSTPPRRSAPAQDGAYAGPAAVGWPAAGSAGAGW